VKVSRFSVRVACLSPCEYVMLDVKASCFSLSWHNPWTYVYNRLLACVLLPCNAFTLVLIDHPIDPHLDSVSV